MIDIVTQRQEKQAEAVSCDEEMRLRESGFGILKLQQLFIPMQLIFIHSI